MEQEIVKEYLNGKSITQLSKEYPITYGKIQKILKENNVTIRGGRKKKQLTPKQKEQLKKQFFENVPLKQIGKNLGYNVDIIRRTVEELQLTRSNNRVNFRIKSNYFSTINDPVKAYWLGFLFTDGCVDKPKGENASGRIRLQLQEADLQILEKYKQDLGIDGKIIYDRRVNSTCCSVEFVDNQIFKDLGKYGIIPNKTYECHHIPYELIPKEYLPAFALGLFDGDGSLSYSQDFFKDVTINFTSYYESVVKDFQTIVDSLINKTDHNKVFFTSAWHAQWRGRLQALSILDILYTNCPRHLDRKYQKYLQLKNSLK